MAHTLPAPGKVKLLSTPWKVNRQRNEDAAWYYPEVTVNEKGIKGRISFWKGVQIER
ncbi:DUF427 domain-containing protein [Maribacter polysiphoniae]|uniref:DUF427 domain-containing protein n=1 Tax=Maribacter polysiphoniae TaxID=429344 RepID=UPI0030810EA1